ncbi:MAG: NAD-dependent epimerase/dehydratase family protein [Candidatus Hodarchaeota archaeon]
MNNEILITGTDGFIGSYLKSYFLENQYRVYGTVYNLREPDEYEVKIDFRKKEEFQKLPNKKFEVIIHTVGTVDQTIPKKLMMSVNARGTKFICNWAANHKCKHIIFTSSVSAYGYKLLGEDRSEERTRRTLGIFSLPYMKSKAKAERYIEKSGLNYTILRLPPVLGKGDTYLSPAIIPKLLQGTFVFCGKKDRKFSTLNLKNLGPLLTRIIQEDPYCEVFNCTDFEITWNELIKEYAKQLDIDLIKQYKPLLSCLKRWSDKHYLLILSFARFGCHYSNDKLINRYNFTPIYSWKDGIKEAVDGYFQNKSNVKRNLSQNN